MIRLDIELNLNQKRDQEFYKLAKAIRHVETIEKNIYVKEEKQEKHMSHQKHKKTKEKSKKKGKSILKYFNLLKPIIL